MDLENNKACHFASNCCIIPIKIQENALFERIVIYFETNYRAHHHRNMVLGMLYGFR
jgi:hypothetical protein